MGSFPCVCRAPFREFVLYKRCTNAVQFVRWGCQEATCAALHHFAREAGVRSHTLLLPAERSDQRWAALWAAGCPGGFSGHTSCVLHRKEGQGSLLDTARACQGLLSGRGGHFCATCCLSMMIPAAFPSLALDKLFKPTVMFPSHTGDAQDPSNRTGGCSKQQLQRYNPVRYFSALGAVGWGPRLACDGKDSQPKGCGSGVAQGEERCWAAWERGLP